MTALVRFTEVVNQMPKSAFMQKSALFILPCLCVLNSALFILKGSFMLNSILFIFLGTFGTPVVDAGAADVPGLIMVCADSPHPPCHAYTALA